MSGDKDRFWNQDYFRRFADIYAQSVLPLTIFTGAGASLSSGFPTWDDLVERLERQLENLRSNTLAAAFHKSEISSLTSLDSNWKKLDFLSQKLGSQYEFAVRAILKKENLSPPATLCALWSLRPRTFLTLNLDGLAAIAHARNKTGVPLHTETGTSVGGRSDTFSSTHSTLVELHGCIDIPSSWVLSESDLDRMLKNDRYISYLRSTLSQSLVLFYGVGIDDVAVGGHLQYLRDINLNGGDFLYYVRKMKRRYLL